MWLAEWVYMIFFVCGSLSLRGATSLSSSNIDQLSLTPYEIFHEPDSASLASSSYTAEPMDDGTGIDYVASRRLQYSNSNSSSTDENTADPIISSILPQYDPSLTFSYEPGNNSFALTAVGLFIRCSNPKAKIYYEITIAGSCVRGQPPVKISCLPRLSSKSVTYDTPYIQIDTPFGEGVKRKITLVAVLESEAVQAETGYPVDLYSRSKIIQLNYYVEAGSRPQSFAYLAPGIESSGKFIRITLEMKATARAQSAGSQEFADFYSYLGIGPYWSVKASNNLPYSQLEVLTLPEIDIQLNGFEGFYSVSCRNGRQYGILVPYHDGKRFTGKAVKIDLFGMGNSTAAERCMQRVRTENKNGGTGYPAETACVTVLDLSSYDIHAVGFKRGFVDYPYIYLSPGEFDVAVRIDVERFTIASTKFIELGKVSNIYGGYSGGFADGTWACFVPLRSFTGPIGGLRSDLPVDRNHLTPYYHSVVVCVNESGWGWMDNGVDLERLKKSIRNFDLGNIDPDMRGYSDAVRVGRYAYLCPFASKIHNYASRLVRIDLGPSDIGRQLDSLKTSGRNLRDIIDTLDFSQRDTRLAGFSGIFSRGKYIYLVPFRNSHEPRNGQRGNGIMSRLDLNHFDVTGITLLDMSVTERNQIPSLADGDLRGFVSGFACGKYAFYVPFFNGVFSGKIARLRVDLPTQESLLLDLQTIDLAQGVSKTGASVGLNYSWTPGQVALGYRDGIQQGHFPGMYVGYRGGDTSIWPGNCVDVRLSPYYKDEPQPNSDIDYAGGYLCTVLYYYSIMDRRWIKKPVEMIGV